MKSAVKSAFVIITLLHCFVYYQLQPYYCHAAMFSSKVAFVKLPLTLDQYLPAKAADGEPHNMWPPLFFTWRITDVEQQSKRLSENALFPQLFVICKILSSEYQLYACGKIFQMPRFEKKLLFSDSLLVPARFA